MGMCESLSGEKEKQKSAEEASNDDDTDEEFAVEIPNQDDENDIGGYGEDEDVRNPEDEAYMDALKCLDGTDFSKILEGELDWDDDDSDEYSSPLDQVDELIYFFDSLTGA